MQDVDALRAIRDSPLGLSAETLSTRDAAFELRARRVALTSSRQDVTRDLFQRGTGLRPGSLDNESPDIERSLEVQTETAESEKLFSRRTLRPCYPPLAKLQRHR